MVITCKVTHALGALAVAVSLTSALPASAQFIVPIQGTYSGTIQNIGALPGNPSLTEFIALASADNGSFTLNAYDAHGSFDPITGNSTGVNAFVSDDGRGTIFGSFTQLIVFNPDSTQLSTFTGQELFTDGSGIFAGTQGTANFSGSFLRSPDDPSVANFTITFNGSTTVAAPEPGVLSLICLAGAVMGGLSLRHRCPRF